MPTLDNPAKLASMRKWRAAAVYVALSFIVALFVLGLHLREASSPAEVGASMDDLRAENELVLRGMAERGDDLSRSRVFDFTAVFASEQAALAFADKAKALGYSVDIEKSGTVPTQPWDVIASREMTASVDAITDAEITLSDIASALGGKMDGWGSLRPD